MEKFLVTPFLKRPCIENENESYSEKDDTTLKPSTFDEYNDKPNKLEKHDTTVIQEDDINAGRRKSRNLTFVWKSTSPNNLY